MTPGRFAAFTFSKASAAFHAYIQTCIHAYMLTGIQAYRHAGIHVYLKYITKRSTHTHKNTAKVCLFRLFGYLRGLCTAHAYAHVSKQLMPLHPTATPCKT